MSAESEPLGGSAVEQNVEAIKKWDEALLEKRSHAQRVSDGITKVAASGASLLAHAVWFVGWILINTSVLPIIDPFDPFPFEVLTMIVSLEAIFLSAFVLLSQNRQAEMADRRADLDLQINLLTEYEVTRVLTLVDAIADHLGLDAGSDPEIEELKKDVAPDQVLKEIDVRGSGTR